MLRLPHLIVSGRDPMARIGNVTMPELPFDERHEVPAGYQRLAYCVTPHPALRAHVAEQALTLGHDAMRRRPQPVPDDRDPACVGVRDGHRFVTRNVLGSVGSIAFVLVT